MSPATPGHLGTQTLTAPTACAAQVEIRRAHPRGHACGRSWSRGDIPNSPEQAAGLNMDDRVQVIDHRPPDDPRGRAGCHAEVSGRVAEPQARDQ